MQYLALIACYVLGAIPFGLITGKVSRGIDIRDFGSGNIGATNVLRTLGLGPALVVFFFDTAKGLAAVVLCRLLHMHPWFVVTGGVLSIVGHSFSVFLKFQGGKGVATSLGMIIGLNPVIAGIAFVGWLIIAAVTRYISVASIIAAISVPVMMFLWNPPVHIAYRIIALIAATLIVVKHRSNIKRLMNGTESRVGQRVKVDEPKEEAKGDE